MRWCILHISNHYRLLRGHYGGYLNGDSWDLNSGIVKVDEKDEEWLVYGESGSCYACPKHAEGLSTIMISIIESFKKSTEVEIITMEDYLADNRDED